MSNAEVVSVTVDNSSEVSKHEHVDKNKPSVALKLKNFVLSQLFSIGITLSITVGIFAPQPAVFLNERIHLAKVCLLVIMFFVGLRLQFQEAKSAIKSYKLVIFGLILVLIVRPIFSVNILNQIQQFGPLIGGQRLNDTSSNSSAHEKMPILGPEEFRLALQIFSMCPSPIAVSLIMVTTANGHRGMSILVSSLGTIVTVFLTPPMLVWLVPTLKHLHIDVGKVILHTVIWILLPMVIGRSLRFLSPVKAAVKKMGNLQKYIVIGSIVFIFLVKVSEMSASGNLGRTSIVSILCVTALGTSLTIFYVIVVYSFLSILPWFSKASTVTLSILCCVVNMVIVFTVIDALPENAGDKGMMALPGIFVALVLVIIINCFIMFTKVPESDSEDSKDKLSFEGGETEVIKESNINSKVNEVAVFIIYTDEMPVEQ